VLVIVLVHTFNYKREFHIPADQVAEIENQRTLRLAAQA
jgi:cytochrome o ubiquinol oxidase subunit 1